MVKGAAYELSKLLVKTMANQNDNGCVELFERDWNIIVMKYLVEHASDERASNLTLPILLLNDNYFKYKIINKDNFANSLYSIELQSKPQLCNKYLRPEGCPSVKSVAQGSCEDLHFCLHYLMGDCKFKDKCKFNHNVLDKHNQIILRKYLMHRLNKKEIASILNVTNFLENKRPLICKGYNNVGGCKFEEKCTSLHICSHYIKDDCKFGKNCKRAHNLLDPSIKEVLIKRNINPNQKPRQIISDINEILKRSENDGNEGGDDDDDSKSDFDDSDYDDQIDFKKTKNLEETATAKEAIRFASLKNSQDMKLKKVKEDKRQVADMLQICTFHLRGKCLFASSCALYHQPDKLPYQWQYEKDVDEWLNFEANQSIEKAYCECSDEIKIPGKASGNPDIEINFKTMKYNFVKLSYQMLGYFRTNTTIGSGNVRRLTTDSQLEQSFEYDYLTHWKWFWRDNKMVWIEFIEDEQGYPGSNKLEKEFQNNPSKKFNFQISGPYKFSYEIDFVAMTQTNLHTNVVRNIMRRPDVFDPVRHKPVSISLIGQTNDSLQIIFPKTWGSSMMANTGNASVQLVKVEATSTEYKEIETLFKQTVKIPLKSISRIENKEIWSFYYMKKQAIMKRKPSQNVTKRLFHGTSKDFIKAICHQGFDFRLSGTRSGHIYGMGSYFARDASYSCGYTNSGQLFVAEVTVGEYTKGSSDLRRPPPKASASLEMYDSCVDDPFNPAIFIIFDNHQAYPEYLIEY